MIVGGRRQAAQTARAAAVWVLVQSPAQHGAVAYTKHTV